MDDFHTLTQDHPNLVGLNVTVPHKQAILSSWLAFPKKPKPSVQ